METQKRSHEAIDPDYAVAGTSDQQAKRQRVLEQDAKENVRKKIQGIVRTEFEREINIKERELQNIDTRLNEALLLMDKLRACIVATYYGKGCHVGPSPVSSLEAPPPSIHPAVKKYLGKAPKGQAAPVQVNTQSNTQAASHERLGPQEKGQEHEVRTGLRDVNPLAARLARPGVVGQPGPVVFEERHARFKMKKKIIIGNVSKYIPVDNREANDMSSHKWMVYVRGPKNTPDISSFVSKVWFFLHHSYKPNDLVEVSSPPFHLTRRGWGEFPVRVQLHFVNPRNKKVDIIHHLKLDKTFTGLQTLGAETVVQVEIEKEDNQGSLPTSSDSSFRLTDTMNTAQNFSLRENSTQDELTTTQSSQKQGSGDNGRLKICSSESDRSDLISKRLVKRGTGDLGEPKESNGKESEEYHMTIAHDQDQPLKTDGQEEEEEVDVCEDRGDKGRRHRAVTVGSQLVSSTSRTESECNLIDSGEGRAKVSKVLATSAPVSSSHNLQTMSASLSLPVVLPVSPKLEPIVDSIVHHSTPKPSPAIVKSSSASNSVSSDSSNNNSSTNLPGTLASPCATSSSSPQPHLLTIIKDPSLPKHLLPTVVSASSIHNSVSVSMTTTTTTTTPSTSVSTSQSGQDFPTSLHGQTVVSTPSLPSSTSVVDRLKPRPTNPSQQLQGVTSLRLPSKIVIKSSSHSPQTVVQVTNPTRLVGQTQALRPPPPLQPSPLLKTMSVVSPSSLVNSDHLQTVISSTNRPLVRIMTPSSSPRTPSPSAARQVSLLTGQVVTSRPRQPVSVSAKPRNAGLQHVVVRNPSSTHPASLLRLPQAHHQAMPQTATLNPLLASIQPSGHTVIKVMNKTAQGSQSLPTPVISPLGTSNKVISAAGLIKQEPYDTGIAGTSLAQHVKLNGHQGQQIVTVVNAAGDMPSELLTFHPSKSAPAPSQSTDCASHQMVLSLPGGVTVPFIPDPPQEKMSAVGITKHGKGYRANLPQGAKRLVVSEEERLRGQYEVLRAFKENPELYKKKPVKRVVLATNDLIDGEEDILPQLP